MRSHEGTESGAHRLRRYGTLAAVLSLIAWGLGYWWYSPKKRVERLLREIEERPGYDSLEPGSTRRSLDEVHRDLAKLGAKGEAVLIDFLTAGEWRKRQLAALELGGLKSARAIVSLRRTVGDPHPLVRAAACEAIGALNEPAAGDVLIAAVEDPDERVRAAAISALGELRVPEAADVIVASLEDSSLRVRASAARALGRLQMMSTAQALASALQDDPWVQREAAVALAKMGCTDGVPHLLEALRDVGAPDCAQRVEIIRCLGALHDPRATGVLARLAREDGWEEVRRAAALAIDRCSVR